MIEILVLVWLWRVNGANARAKGEKPGKYRAWTFALWFGLEFIGTLLGAAMSSLLLPEDDPFWFSYMFGVIGASLGGFISYLYAKNGVPQNGETLQNPNAAEWNQVPPLQYSDSQGLLRVPASILIREELGGYGGNRDYFYLNGQPVCALAPGMGFNFKTRFVKNTITIGNPYQDSTDAGLSVRFIASDNGVIEIHASEGRMIPELFKNYSSN